MCYLIKEFCREGGLLAIYLTYLLLIWVNMRALRIILQANFNFYEIMGVPLLMKHLYVQYTTSGWHNDYTFWNRRTVLGSVPLLPIIYSSRLLHSIHFWIIESCFCQNTALSNLIHTFIHNWWCVGNKDYYSIDHHDPHTLNISAYHHHNYLPASYKRTIFIKGLNIQDEPFKLQLQNDGLKPFFFVRLLREAKESEDLK
jgi:hypothetical protein